MNVRRLVGAFLVLGFCLAGQNRVNAQCCLTDLFAGCGSCFQKAPRAYAVAPVAAPIVAPVAAPVMVPVQKTSYVPETTYRTEYQCVPVTTYKPSCEIDPCTGCSVECMQPVTQYVQQPVNVPVTQYRAVTTTQYVQMQPGYAPPAGYAPAPGYAPPPGYAPAPTAPGASPFSAVQTTPQAWGAAGADVTRQPPPGLAPPALPPATVAPAPTYQYQQPQFQYPQPAGPQPIIPQAGTYAPPQQPMQPQLQPQPTQPPALSPAPSLRPIPEMPRNGRPDSNGLENGNGNGTGTAASPGAFRTAPASARANQEREAEVFPIARNPRLGPACRCSPGMDPARPPGPFPGFSSRPATRPRGALPMAAVSVFNIRRPPCRPGGRRTGKLAGRFRRPSRRRRPGLRCRVIRTPPSTPP